MNKQDSYVIKSQSSLTRAFVSGMVTFSTAILLISQKHLAASVIMLIITFLLLALAVAEHIEYKRLEKNLF